MADDSDGFERTLNGFSRCKSAKVTKKRETLEVERGKPHKRETQIMVGELLLGIKRCNGPVMVDKYLSRQWRTEQGL